MVLIRPLFLVSLIVASPVLASSEEVRVRIFSEQTSVSVEGKQLVYDSKHLKFKSVISAKDLKQKEVALTGKKILVNGTRASNRILLQKNKQALDVISILNLEQYVFGVLISEMPYSWPLEALKAQAIAIRSYALAVKKEKEMHRYHLESSVLDQLYRGIHEEDLKNPKYKKALRAVFETRAVRLLSNQMAMPKNAASQIAKSYYHSDCGGSTIRPEAVWGLDPARAAQVVAVDPSCAKRKRSAWENKITDSELNQLLAQTSQLASKNSGKVSLEKREDMNLGIRAEKSRFLDGRVSQVVLKMGSTILSQITGDLFRQILGFDRIKSTRFEVRQQGGSILVQGRGYGHGAGLCQWGSRDWALQGWDYQAILRHYYPDFQLTPAAASGLAVSRNVRTNTDKNN